MSDTTTFTIRQNAPAGTRYAPTAYDRQIGTEIPVNTPSFHGTGKLVKAEIVDGGEAAKLTIEVTDPAGNVRSALGRGHDKGYSYGFNVDCGLRTTPIPAIPKDAWRMLIGSCGCLHAITEHTEDGCRSCPCVVPIGQLAVKIKGAGDE